MAKRTHGWRTSPKGTYEHSGNWTRFLDDPPGHMRYTPPPTYNPLAPYTGPRPVDRPYKDLRESKPKVGTGAGKPWKDMNMSRDPVTGTWGLSDPVPTKPRGRYRPPKLPLPKWATPLSGMANFAGLAGEAWDWLDPAIQGPSGYQWPGDKPSYHWGPYNCGNTPYIGYRVDSGCLNEGTFACLPGQVMEGNLPYNRRYGQTLNLPRSHSGHRSVTLGRWNGATRFTVIEHWCWLPGQNPGVLSPGNPIVYIPTKAAPLPMGIPPPPDIVDKGPGGKTGGAGATGSWGDADDDDDDETKDDPKPDDLPDVWRPPWLEKPTDTKPGGKRPRPPIIHVGNKPTYPDKPGDEKRRFESGSAAAKLYGLYQRAGDNYGMLTEIGDALDCMEKAAGRGYKAPKGLHNRIAKMADHLASGGGMNMGQLGGCLISNQVSDYVIGKVNQIASQAAVSNPYWRRPVGPGAGSYMQRNMRPRFRSIR